MVRLRLAAIITLSMPAVLAWAQAPTLAVPPAATAALDTTTGAPAAVVGDAAERLLLASSTMSYPVTPGDVYQLTYVQAGQPITMTVLVESDYTLNLSLFGKLNTTGLTFTALKPRVEKLVTDAYPRGTPVLAIASVGVFQVVLKGEVPRTAFVTCWGLSRLSEVTANNLGSSSSIREVGVINRDGDFGRYDLFRAERLGELDHNPLMKPGDSVVIYRRGREVEVAGEVYRPGSYQLLGGEGLRDLVETYGGQLTERADMRRLRIDRVSAEEAQTLYVDLRSGYGGAPDLRDGDVVTVAAKTQTLPLVFFEGAVTTPTAAAPAAPAATGQGATQQAAQPSYGRVSHAYRSGETLSDAVRLVWDSISPLANLRDAFVIREGSADPMSTNIEAVLAGSAPDMDLVLKPYDRVVIPVRQFFVTVSGSVGAPGSYSYVPNRTYDYYVQLAGGGDISGALDSVVVTDSKGGPRALADTIQPEDRIYVAPALVIVSGAVFAPGSFAYGPQRTAAYYINLAGGINPQMNRNNSMAVTDSLGNPKALTDIIRPGDRIFVHSNSFLYNFNTYFPVISSGIAFISTLIGIVQLLLSATDD